MTSLQQIAHIVRRKRTEADFSVAAIAAQAGVPVDVVQGLEALEPGISTAQLGRIAKALSLDLVALMNGEERSVPGSAVFLRHQAFQDFGETDREVAQVALRSALQFLELSDALSATGLRRDGSFKRREAGDNAAQDGYRLARTVRRTLKQPVDPLGDLRKLLEEHFELVVLVAKTSSSVTAMAVADLTGAAAVVLSAGDPERRKNPVLARVHLAHELCHVLFDPLNQGVQLVVDQHEEKRSKAVRAEQRARAFAAELLLPAAGLQQLLGRPSQLDSVSLARDLVGRARNHFRTSWEIATLHLGNLGYLHPRLKGTLRASGSVADDTSLPLPGEPSIELKARLQRAWQGGLVTDGQVRGCLGLGLHEPLPWDQGKRRFCSTPTSLHTSSMRGESSALLTSAGRLVSPSSRKCETSCRAGKTGLASRGG